MDATNNEFQSTFPRGERRSRRCGFRWQSAISIHVPAWGTTDVHHCYPTMNHISIHVPAWGTTGGLERETVPGIISIHVPAWGTTMESEA